MIRKKCAGILLPVSTLPSAQGIGSLGKSAYDFVDFLNKSRMTVWQILPLSPTNYGDSPYYSCCGDAYNYYFIDLDILVGKNLLTEEEVSQAKLNTSARKVNYGKLFHSFIPLLRIAFSRYPKTSKRYQTFLQAGEYFDFAVFMALKEKFEYRSWTEWEEPYRTYQAETVQAFAAEHATDVEFWQFTQYTFLKQWRHLKKYANEHNVQIIGDLPFYVAYDSVDVWKYGNAVFQMDERRSPAVVAGVPPDRFSENGQLWGNPVYDWSKLRRTDYAWWSKRIDHALSVCDYLRLDHFRGFDRYYVVPYGEISAEHGHWENGPKAYFFRNMHNRKLIAEDIGISDDSVRDLRIETGFPGMRVLEYAFDGNPNNPDKPSSYIGNCVCYVSTHDDMPLKEYVSKLSAEQLQIFRTDLLSECRKIVHCDTSTVKAICESVIRLAFCSKANMVVVSYWDVLGLGAEARMNTPSTVSSRNWTWRFTAEDFSLALSNKLSQLSKKTLRS